MFGLRSDSGVTTAPVDLATQGGGSYEGLGALVPTPDFFHDMHAKNVVIAVNITRQYPLTFD